MTSQRAPDEEVLRAMAELAAEFEATLPSKIDDLAAAVRAALARRDDAERWAEARVQAHRLHGTAGSYGFGRVGSLAGLIEEALDDVRSDEGSRRASAWQRVDEGLTSLLVSRTIPPASGHPSLPAPATTSGPPPSVVPRPVPRVLVVDDDPAFLAHVEGIAQQQMFTVRTARTAAEAIDAAKAERLDAALVDVHLNAASSYDLARQLRNITPTLSLAFVSADGSVATRVAAAHAGASVFLSKPLGAYELTTALRRILSDRGVERSRVLVLDDDGAFGALVAALLDLEAVHTSIEVDPARVLDALERVRPDLLLVDVHMPKIGGLDVCRTIRVTPRWQSLPILVVTQDPTLATRVAAFEAGADDYLLKPVIPQELASRVRVRIERARLLHEMMNVDPLTQLLSRRGFLDALAPRISDALRHDKPLSVALLDVDHFKKVNDRYGHAAGDRVLAGVGELLASRFRLEDLRCRWGGEEFVVAFPGEDGPTIVGVLERVLGELQAMDFRGDDGAPFHVTFSAGVATLPVEGEGAEGLLRVADRRLYAAKAAGRARVIGP